MSTDQGWWARKLGQTQAYVPPPQAPQVRQVPAPVQQVAPQYQQQPVEPKVTIENLFEMAQYWTGSVAHQTDPYPCPQCGGQHYYSRTNGGVTRGPAPAPMCFDCGYNGMFQQGDPATWQAGGA